MKSEKWAIGSNQSQEIGTELNNFHSYPLLYLVQSDYCVCPIECDPNAHCSYTLESYTCECNIGYFGDGTTCTDINECEDDICGSNGSCSNTPGSFICTCDEGYTVYGNVCTDIDECEIGICDSHAACLNTPGSFICTCDEGYFGDGITCGKSRV